MNEEKPVMFIEERHRIILEHLEQHGRIQLGDIQKMFMVSFDTARRDLRILEEKGLLKRTHGGALPLRQIGFSRPKKATARDIEEVKENYYLIALKAVSMIQDRDVIFIPSATVGHFMAQNLPQNIQITVVVNSIIIAEDLRQYDNLRILVAAGEMDGRGNFYDSFAIDTIRRIRFDKCFITAACISADFGLSIQRTNGVGFFNAVIGNSKSVIGLFPTEKIGFESILSICSADRLDYLITDWDAPEEELKKLDDMGIQIVVVEKEAE